MDTTRVTPHRLAQLSARYAVAADFTRHNTVTRACVNARASVHVVVVFVKDVRRYIATCALTVGNSRTHITVVGSFPPSKRRKSEVFSIEIPNLKFVCLMIYFERDMDLIHLKY